jgi:lactoylglutathione lyase
MATVTNHVGLCVTDLDRSRRFYEGLGFVHQRDLRPPDDVTGRLLDVAAPVALTAVYLTMGTFVLELLHFDRPGNAPARPRPFTEPGLTHLSFDVDDLPATLALVRDLGGEVVESSDIGVAILVRDPDGQLLELIAARRS